MIQDFVGRDQRGLPPCRGRDPQSVRRFIVACRASAVVLGREGDLAAARRLVEVAAVAERQLMAVRLVEYVAAA